MIDFKNYDNIPPHLYDQIREYVNNGRPLCSFLEKIFSNDFQGAVSRADDFNLLILPTYAIFVHMETPIICHGSLEDIKYWQNEGYKNCSRKLPRTALDIIKERSKWKQ